MMYIYIYIYMYVCMYMCVYIHIVAGHAGWSFLTAQVPPCAEPKPAFNLKLIPDIYL